jgi:hypothetical protein
VVNDLEDWDLLCRCQMLGNILVLHVNIAAFQELHGGPDAMVLIATPHSEVEVNKGDFHRHHILP